MKKSESLHFRFSEGEVELLRHTAKRYGCSVAYVIRQLMSRAPHRYEYVDGQRRRVIDMPEVLKKISKIKLSEEAE